MKSVVCSKSLCVDCVALHGPSLTAALRHSRRPCVAAKAARRERGCAEPSRAEPCSVARKQSGSPVPSVRANQAEGGRCRRSHASAAAAQRVSPYGKGVTRSASGWQLGQRHWRCARVGTPRPPGQPLRRLHASALADGIGRSSAGSIRRIGRDRLNRRRWAEGSAPGWTHAFRTDAIRHRCWSRSHLQMSRRECEIGRECGGLSIDLFVVRLIPNICACKKKQPRPRGNHAQRGYPVRA
jgi:hypothetical protein